MNLSLCFMVPQIEWQDNILMLRLRPMHLHQHWCVMLLYVPRILYILSSRKGRVKPKSNEIGICRFSNSAYLKGVRSKTD